MKLSIEEMAKLVKELQGLSAKHKELQDQARALGYTTKEMRLEIETVARRAHDLNQKRIKLLPLYTQDEIAEMRKIMSTL